MKSFVPYAITFELKWQVTFRKDVEPAAFVDPVQSKVGALNKNISIFKN